MQTVPILSFLVEGRPQGLKQVTVGNPCSKVEGLEPGQNCYCKRPLIGMVPLPEGHNQPWDCQCRAYRQVNNADERVQT